MALCQFIQLIVCGLLQSKIRVSPLVSLSDELVQLVYHATRIERIRVRVQLSAPLAP